MESTLSEPSLGVVNNPALPRLLSDVDTGDKASSSLSFFFVCLWELNVVPLARYSSFSVAQTCPSPSHREGWSGSGAPSVRWYQAVVFQPFHLSVTAAWMGLYHKDLTDSFIFLSCCWFQSSEFRPNRRFSAYASFPSLCPKAKPVEATWFDGSRVLLPPPSFLSSSPWPPWQEQGGKKIFCLMFTPCPRLAPILPPSVGDAAAEGTAGCHTGASSPAGNSVGGQEILCLLMRVMFKHVRISVGTLC